jgi:hypothetical protein
MTKRKTTPHLKRGPKPQPRPPKRKAGRPEKPLCAQPYRHWLAHYEALVVMGFGRRQAMRLVEAAHECPVAEDGHIYFTIRLPIEKNSERLRALAKRHAARPEDRAWLKAAVEAILIAAAPLQSAA